MALIADRINLRVQRWRHLRVAREVLATPPVRASDDGVVLLSMIGTRVLLPYLVAVKSLHRALGRGRIVILDDGTLTVADRRVLAAQLGDPEIEPIAGVDTGPCPRGGTWERLLSILDRRAHDYVIQLDSDTVTLGPVDAVAAAIDAGRSFSLRGEDSSALMTIADFGTWRARYPAGGHIQDAAEYALGDVAAAGVPIARYFRGCSGFAGFSQGQGGRALAEAFASAQTALLGRARWAEWGTEQVTSNIVIANDPAVDLLAYDQYHNYWGSPLPDGCNFAHFLGTCRYDGTAYIDATRQAIAMLRG